MANGLFCPECSKTDNKAIDSRVGRNLEYIRRRRECVCGFRWTTIEISLPSIPKGGHVSAEDTLKELMTRHAARELIEKLDAVKQSILDIIKVCPEANKS